MIFPDESRKDGTKVSLKRIVRLTLVLGIFFVLLGGLFVLSDTLQLSRLSQALGLTLLTLIFMVLLRVQEADMTSWQDIKRCCRDGCAEFMAKENRGWRWFGFIIMFCSIYYANWCIVSDFTQPQCASSRQIVSALGIFLGLGISMFLGSPAKHSNNKEKKNVRKKIPKKRV